MSIQCKFFVTNYLWTENLLLHWNIFWNEISNWSLQSNFNELKVHVVLMYFFDAILIDKNSTQRQHMFLFYFLKEKNIIVVLISLFDTFLTILKMKVVCTYLLNAFLFLLHFYQRVFLSQNNSDSEDIRKHGPLRKESSGIFEFLSKLLW